MKESRPICPRCNKLLRSGSINCPYVMNESNPVSDPDGLAITFGPCSCTAGKVDDNSQQFVDIVKSVLGIP